MFRFQAPALPTEESLEPLAWLENQLPSLAALSSRDFPLVLQWWEDSVSSNWHSLLQAQRLQAGVAVLGLSFFWDPISRQYYRGSQPVQWSEIRTVMDDALNQSQLRVREATRQVAQGLLHPITWREGVSAEIALSHLALASIAQGGLFEMSVNALHRVSQEVASQLSFFNDLLRQVEQGSLVIGEALLGRAAMYASAAWGSFYELEREIMLVRGMTHERNILEPSAESCDGCRAESDRGDVPIGDLVPIGSRDCLSNDRCHYEYSRVVESLGVPA